jgi:hypothetical protein
MAMAQLIRNMQSSRHVSHIVRHLSLQPLRTTGPLRTTWKTNQLAANTDILCVPLKVLRAIMQELRL